MTGRIFLPFMHAGLLDFMFADPRQMNAIYSGPTTDELSYGMTGTYTPVKRNGGWFQPDSDPNATYCSNHTRVFPRVRVCRHTEVYIPSQDMTKQCARRHPLTKP